MDKELNRTGLINALDQAARYAGVPTVMAWCIEWEQSHEDDEED